MAQLNVTLNQEEMLQLLSENREGAFAELLQNNLNSILLAESEAQLHAKGLQPYTPDDIIARMPAGMTAFPDECYNALDLLNAKHWEKTPYEASTEYPQDLIHRTHKGDIVRSKNEVNICDALLYYGIPYHYEQPLRLFGRDIHPDIVAYSYYYRRLIYWEHAGLASDMGYVHANMPKYLDYLQSGIVPWRNLIITFDDENGGLDSRIIDNIIHLWFLGE